MSEATVAVPAVGRVKKQYVYVGGAVVVGVVGYAYWRRSAAVPADIPAYTEEDVAADGVTATGGGAAGAPANSGGRVTDSSTSPDSDNEWVQQASEALAGVYDEGALSVALGRYITHEGLTAPQKEMVQAAIGRVGYPPGGHYPLTSDMSPSPSTFGEPRDLKATSTATTAVALSWSPVSGASGYHVFRSDVGIIGDASGTTFTAKGLEPNRSYTFTVAARTATGADGPHSAPLTRKTGPVTLAKPAVPTVSDVTKTSVKASVHAVAGATGYDWWLNGSPRGHSDGPSAMLTQLRAGTTYSVTVRADTANQSPGPFSAARKFTTKK